MTHHDSSNMILARRKLRLLNSQTDLKVAHQNLFLSAKKRVKEIWTDFGLGLGCTFTL